LALNLLYLPFVIDYIARLRFADNRLHWFIRHPLDLAVVTLPFLQPLRFLRRWRISRNSGRRSKARTSWCGSGPAKGFAPRRAHPPQKPPAGAHNTIARLRATAGVGRVLGTARKARCRSEAGTYVVALAE
jgi:hypothetical protein